MIFFCKARKKDEGMAQRFRDFLTTYLRKNSHTDISPVLCSVVPVSFNSFKDKDFEGVAEKKNLITEADSALTGSFFGMSGVMGILRIIAITSNIFAGIDNVH